MKGPVVANDVSPTAISKAKQCYPAVDFRIFDVGVGMLPKSSFDVVVFLSCLVLIRSNRFCSPKHCQCDLPRGLLIIVQRFYELGQQKYGNNVVSAQTDLLNRIPMLIERVVEVDRLTNCRWIVIARK